MKPMNAAGIVLAGLVSSAAHAQSTLNAVYEIPSVYGNRVIALASAAGRLATMEEDTAMTVWDAYAFGIVLNVHKDDYPPNDDWAGAESLTISADGNRVFAGDQDESAVFQVVPVGFEFCGSTPDADETARMSPGGSTVAVISDERLDLFSATTGCLQTNLRMFPGDQGRDVVWNPTGTRIAYTWYDNDTSGDPGWLTIVNTAGGVVDQIALTSGTRVGGVTWSPDGSQIAAHDSDDFLRVFTSSGSLIRSIETDSRDVGDIEWSPNGQYIAVHLELNRVAIYNAATGAEVVRLNVEEGLEGENETIAWRDDSKVIFAIPRTGATAIKVFAPFDSADPSLQIDTPTNGMTTEASSVELGGSATDTGGVNAGLFPESLRYTLDGGPETVIDRATDGTFLTTVDLGTEGAHDIRVICTDLAGNEVEQTVSVVFEVPNLCPADFDESGHVGFDDLVTVLQNWGCEGEACEGDCSDDDQVGFSDLVCVIESWGSCP